MNKKYKDEMWIYNPPVDERRFVVKDEYLKALSEIEFKNVEGGYRSRLKCLNCVENKHIIDKYRGEETWKHFGNHLFVSCQLIVNHVNIDEQFIQKYNVQKHHLSLIKQLYFDFHVTPSGPVFNTADKRPFGNSYMEGDILEVVDTKFLPGFPTDTNEDTDEGYQWIEDNNEVFVDIYNEVIELAIKFIKHLTSGPIFNYIGRRFTGGDWELDPSYYRNEKIETILE